MVLLTIGSVYAPPRLTNPNVVIAQQQYKERQTSMVCERQSLLGHTGAVENVEERLQRAYYWRYGGPEDERSCGTRIQDCLSEHLRSRQCLEQGVTCGFFTLFSCLCAVSFLFP